jgi:glycosyltransferase involved in cell wall biosynthesis
MKIAVWHNLPSGGGKRALHMHVRGLVERGHEVHIWCPETANRTYLPLDQLAPEHITPLQRLPDFGKNPMDHALLTYRRVPETIARMERTCAQAAEEINRGGFDVLFANSCQIFFAPAIARFVRLPRVLYLQEPNRQIYEAMPRLPWMGRDKSERGKWSRREVAAWAHDLVDLRRVRLYAEYEQRNARAFDLVLVNSFFSRESLLRAYGINARVCYLGVDTAHFVPNAPAAPREDFVIGLGALQIQKNIGFVIEALGHVPAPRPRLVWIGNVVNDAYREQLQQLARARQVAFETRVMLSDAEVIDLLNRAAMMVYAPRLEPFGYAPLEANACGLPVISVAEGGVRETVENGVNGLLTDGDPPAMARAIQRLWEDPSLARQMGQKARCIVEQRWSLKAAIDRIEQRLTEAIT